MRSLKYRKRYVMYFNMTYQAEEQGLFGLFPKKKKIMVNQHN